MEYTLTIGIMVVFEKLWGHIIPVVLLGNLNGSERDILHSMYWMAKKENPF